MSVKVQFHIHIAGKIDIRNNRFKISSAFDELLASQKNVKLWFIENSPKHLRIPTESMENTYEWKGINHDNIYN